MPPGVFPNPRPLVALACGSRSNSRTRRPTAATQAARLTAVVVLPTPPFWLATAITLVGTRKEYRNRGAGSSVRGGQPRFPFLLRSNSFAGFCCRPIASYRHELDPYAA